MVKRTSSRASNAVFRVRILVGLLGESRVESPAPETDATQISLALDSGRSTLDSRMVSVV